jgi:hypothetical protein
MRVKMFAALSLAVVLTIAGAAWAGAFTRVDSCCAPGADCCFPGSPCCEDSDCCGLGLACCPDGKCCESVKETQVKADCCAVGLECCASGAACCTTAGSVK